MRGAATVLEVADANALAAFYERLRSWIMAEDELNWAPFAARRAGCHRRDCPSSRTADRSRWSAARPWPKTTARERSGHATAARSVCPDPSVRTLGVERCACRRIL